MLRAEYGIENRVPDRKKIYGAECRDSTSTRANIQAVTRPELDESSLCNCHGDDLRERLKAVLNVGPEDREANAASAAESHVGDWDVAFVVSTAHWPDAL